MKKTLILLCILLSLTSCSEQEVKDNNTKADFFVETRDGRDFSGDFILEKTTQVDSSQNIVLSSNASGRVASILVRAGETVSKGQTIAYLEDNIGNYDININRALNAIERAKINRESTTINLDTSIFNARLNLEKLESNLDALKISSEKNILLAEDLFENSKYEGLDSKSSLELEQLDNTIAKAKLDFQTNVRLDDEKIILYKSQLRKTFNSLTFFMDEVIEKSDSVLGVTSKNRTARREYDNYLGIRDSSQKRLSRVYLQGLIDYRDNDTFEDYNILLQEDIQEQDIIEIIDFTDEGYNKIKTVLSSLQETLNNSIASEGSLSQSTISAFSSQTNIHQSQLQGEQGAFISFSSGVVSFLNTYKDRQDSSLKAIEIQETGRDIQLKGLLSGELNAQINYDITQVSSQDNIQNLESQIKIAKNSLDNAIENKDIGLRSLQNTIAETEISYSSALKEKSKLVITSPIEGVIADIFIDEGQEVFSNTRLFNMLSETSPELQVSFSIEEKSFIKEGGKAYISIKGEQIEGTISAISNVADAYLNYKATIIFESSVSIIGNLVTVKFPVETDNMLIPINIITSQGEDIGLVKTLSGSSIENVRVRMGEMYGEYVEVISCAKNCETLNIITNDVGNYDANKFIIVEK